MVTLTPRPFRWDDLPELAELIDRVHRAEGDQRVVDQASVKEFFGQPDLWPEQNCTVFPSDHGLQGYTLLHHEAPLSRAVLDAVIHPDYLDDQLRSVVLQTALERARQLGTRALHICRPEADSSWRQLLEGRGFKPVRTYWLMRWEVGQLPPTQAPAGFSVRAFRPGDGAILANIQNGSFQGNWGFSPNTAEQVEYRAAMTITGAGGIQFLQNDWGTAGYCWTSVEEAHDGAHVGTICMIGIDPNFRGQGLSKPILIAGMQHLLSRGVGYIKLDVDSTNDPAVGLYTSVGFAKAMGLQWFEAEASTA